MKSIAVFRPLLCLCILFESAFCLIASEQPKSPLESNEAQLKKLKGAAANGDAESQSALSDKYRVGDGVQKNLSEAIGWCRKAAAQRHAYAELRLSIIYSIGDGVKKDSEKSLYWAKRAVESYEKDAGQLGSTPVWQYFYGVACGLEKKPRQATQLFLRAANQGHRYS